MVFALTFTDRVDPTALATFVLALFTVISVVIGLKALRNAQSDIDLSRREVEQAHRPVVVPVVDDAQRMRFSGRGEAAARPSLIEHLLVPIKNIGSGPALNIEAFATVVNRAGDPTDAAPSEERATYVAMGVGEVIALEFPIPRLADVPSFAIRLTYADVAEKAWTTSATYLAHDAGGRYVKLRIPARP